MFEYIKNIWEGIKDFFGFFASVKHFIEFIFTSVSKGFASLGAIYAMFPIPSAVLTVCVMATMIFIVLRVVNRK